MDIKQIYSILQDIYPVLDPHHQTWLLWIKSEKTDLEIFEVAIGTILIQNTNWKNAEKAITDLMKHITSFQELYETSETELKELIRPAGFYSQKARYLQNLAEYLKDVKNDPKILSRKKLLSIKGIGKETADSILTFCYGQPVLVIGTYTRRFLARYSEDVSLLKVTSEAIQQRIIKSFTDINGYKAGHLHALIVVHNQNRCHKQQPDCLHCEFKKDCWYGQQPEAMDRREMQSLIAPERKN